MKQQILLHLADEYKIINFLEGLEDGSSSRSDQDKVFVFLAPQATELWYRWNEGEQQWEWTPDKESWMLCSRTTVSGGKWKDETPAPENVEIIRYLDTIRPVPSDEQFLARFDVIAILHNLKTLEGGEEQGGGGEGVGDLIDAILKEVNRVKEELNANWMNEEFSLSSV